MRCRAEASPQPSPARRSLVERVKSLSSGGAALPPPSRPDAAHQVCIGVNVNLRRRKSIREDLTELAGDGVAGCACAAIIRIPWVCGRSSPCAVQAAVPGGANTSPGAATSDLRPISTDGSSRSARPPSEEEAAELARMRQQLERQLVCKGRACYGRKATLLHHCAIWQEHPSHETLQQAASRRTILPAARPSWHNSASVTRMQHPEGRTAASPPSLGHSCCARQHLDPAPRLQRCFLQLSLHVMFPPGASVAMQRHGCSNQRHVVSLIAWHAGSAFGPDRQAAQRPNPSAVTQRGERAHHRETEQHLLDRGTEDMSG